jgi:raffinose/stachyose/melibiose transport system substrate-binding protein
VKRDLRRLHGLEARVTGEASGACVNRISVLKSLFLVLVVTASVWALWPRTGDQPTALSLSELLPARAAAQADGETMAQAAGVRHAIRVAPGAFYMPGTRPMDVGRPLEGLATVAREFERLHPDTRIEFLGVPARREWLVTQLMSGEAPDILSVNVEDVWQDVQKGWYVPLDAYLERPNRFVEAGEPGSRQWWDMFKYQAVSRGKAAPDGLMYCITLDMVETGIIYNKDIFAKLGLEPPRDWIEFMEIQRTIKEAGYIPMLVALGSLADWGIDLIFDQLYYDLLPLIDLRQDPNREQYLEGYLDWDEIAFLFEQGFFTRNDPRYVEMWRIIREWRQYMPDNLQSVDFLRLFLTQRGAMFWTSSPIVNLLSRDPDLAFDWGIFYLPPIPREYSRYSGAHPMCVIGGAAMQYVVTNSSIRDTGDAATSERLDRSIAFLEFLTLPENADRVVNELVCFLPNIVGVEPHPQLMPFHEILQRRYTTTKWLYTFDLRFSDIKTRMLGLYLDPRGIDLEGFLEWMERNTGLAVETVKRRQGLDMETLEREWLRRGDLMDEFEGLPE